jgi:hypothetical protein
VRANQLRLWFASMAYVLICALRRIGLVHTQFAQAKALALFDAVFHLAASAVELLVEVASLVLLAPQRGDDKPRIGFACRPFRLGDDAAFAAPALFAYAK